MCFFLDHPLVLFRFAAALLLLVLVLAEVHDSADRRYRSRGDLDEVEPLLLGDGQRGRRRHDPELLSRLVDHADFTDTDALVGANAIITSGRTIECDMSSYAVFCSAGAAIPGDFVAISSLAAATNASIDRAPRSPADRLRTDTVPSAASRSPVTSM